jgi:transcriptional regulator with XRE-family HTH domain
MINRIRDIRRQKGMTLADVAARCSPPTTAQTIGRLETGTRNLSLIWMNRIALALEVDPELLVRGDAAEQAKMVARLTDVGAEALTTPRDAILPTELVGEGTSISPNWLTGMCSHRAPAADSFLAA